MEWWNDEKNIGILSRFSCFRVCFCGEKKNSKKI
jgi:hypothetical protein